MELLFKSEDERKNLRKELEGVKILTVIDKDWKVEFVSGKIERLSQEEWNLWEARSEDQRNGELS